MKLAVIYEWLARDEASKLDALREAIGKWHHIAQKEFADRVADARDGELPEQVADSLGDEACMLQLTERAMWGSFCVAITSTVEAFLGRICVHRPLSDKMPWAEKPQRAEGIIDRSFDDIAGFAAAKHMRIAANCVKYRAGNTDSAYVRGYGGTLGTAIKFEEMDWKTIIRDVGEFLGGVSRGMPD